MKDLLGSGLVLSVGASAIGKLPASAAKSGVESGLGTAGSFYPTVGSLKGAGMTMKMLKQLKEVK